MHQGMYFGHLYIKENPIVNREDWKMPNEWSGYKNVFKETYEGMAKFVQKQLTKSK